MSRAACAGALGYDRYASFGNRARFRVFGSEPLHAPVPGAGRHHSEQLPMVDALGASPHGKPIAGASLPAVLIARLAIKTAARLAIFPAFPSTVLAKYECHSICDK